MATGYPDYLSWKGRAVGGSGIVSFSFGGDVPGNTSAYFDCPAVPTGYENVYQCIIISCPDNVSIHNVNMKRLSDLWGFFLVYFVTGGVFEFPGCSIGSGETVRVSITNNSASTLDFSGIVTWVSVPI